MSSLYFDTRTFAVSHIRSYQDIMIEIGRILERTGIEARMTFSDEITFASEIDAATFKLACSFATFDREERDRRVRAAHDKLMSSFPEAKPMLPRDLLNGRKQPQKRSWLRKLLDRGLGR